MTALPLAVALWIVLAGSFPFTDWPGSDEPDRSERVILPAPGPERVVLPSDRPRRRQVASRGEVAGLVPLGSVGAPPGRAPGSPPGAGPRDPSEPRGPRQPRGNDEPDGGGRPGGDSQPGEKPEPGGPRGPSIVGYSTPGASIQAELGTADPKPSPGR